MDGGVTKVDSTCFMEEKVFIVVGHVGELPVYVQAHAEPMPECAYFPAGHPWTVSRRILDDLLHSWERMPITLLRDDNPNGMSWFKDTCRKHHNAQQMRTQVKPPGQAKPGQAATQ